MEILRQENYKSSVWTGGLTREVCILPAEGCCLADRNFDVRVSSAVINVTESTFSDFTGFTRYILCLEGNITLNVDGHTVTLDNEHLFQFDGASKVTSVNSSGAIDLNVICKRGTHVCARVAHGEQHLTSVKRMLVFGIGGETMINDTPLRQYDAAWVSGDVHIVGHVLCLEHDF